MFNKKFLKHYYIMLIPAIIWLVLFNIVPMVGIVMAFEDFNPGLGMWKSPFVGFANFEYMFQMSDIRQVMVNTIVIALGKIIANLIVPLVFAILLNELCIQKLYRPIQTIVYLPYFLSWVILAKIVLNIFGYVGPINSVINFFGGDSVNFFGMESMFRPLVIGTDIWKNFGYNAIIYLATMLGIAPELYEAAAVDGAGRFRRIWHITLPGIKMTVALLANDHRADAGDEPGQCAERGLRPDFQPVQSAGVLHGRYPGHLGVQSRSCEPAVLPGYRGRPAEVGRELRADHSGILDGRQVRGI